MVTTTTPRLHDRARAAFAMGSALTELMVSAVALVFAFTGLFGAFPIVMASLASVAIGVGLVLEGGAVGARSWRMLRARDGDSLTLGDVFGGVTAELVSGVLGIACGVLAMFGVAPQSLVATAVIIYSVGLLLGCAALTHGSFSVGGSDESGVDELRADEPDSLFAAASGQMVAGILAAALGIFALLGSQTLSLSLIALLCIATSEVLSGSALGAKMLQAVRR